MKIRHATCACGQLRLTCEGAPVRVSMCHCLACQQRTGSTYGVQARFLRGQVTSIEGRTAEHTRTADSGNPVTFRFCPDCGSTVYWELKGMDAIAVAVGAFADPNFPEPNVSVYEERQHEWVRTPPGPDVEHYD